MISKEDLKDLDLEPTERDKPSPHSSLTFSELYVFLTNMFTEQGGYKVVRIANTNSMEPLIDQNSLVILENLSPVRLNRQPLLPGDIVTYPTTTGNIIHMLEELTPRGWVIRGVNNTVADMSFVPPSVIKWRVVGVFYTREMVKGD